MQKYLILCEYVNVPSARMFHLCERREKFFIDLVWGILWSHWSLKPADVGGVVVLCIGFADIWLPFHQRGAGQVAERTQVQVS